MGRIKNKLNKNAVLIIFQSILLDKCHVIYYEQNSDCLVFSNDHHPVLPYLSAAE